MSEWSRSLDRIGRFARRFRDFGSNKRGTVAIISAIALPVLIGMTGLVAELGHGLLTKAETQRIADLSAYAGALAYNSTNSTTTMNSAAKAVAALNGITASNVSVSLTASPRNSSNRAVLVRINASDLVLLAPVTKTMSSLTIGSNAYAQIGAQTDPCVLALNASGTGVTLSGGTAISAPGCAVASNNTVSVPCGTTISAKIVEYNSAAVPSQPCGGITANAITKTATSDPLAGAAGVVAAVARMSTVSALTSPVAPAAPVVPAGTDITFGYYPTTMSVAGCTGSMSNNTWTLTCPSGGTYNFGNLSIGGGLSVNFNTSGSAATTYNFSGCLVNAGSALTFGPGTYNIAKGIATGGGTTTTFGAGTFNVGASTSACNSYPVSSPSTCNGYSICSTGSTLTIAGPTTFSLAAGIFNSGGSTMSLGVGQANTFKVGPSTASCGSGGRYSICSVGGAGGPLNLGGASGSSLNSSTFAVTNGIYNSGQTTLTLGSGTSNSFNVGPSSDGYAAYVGGGAITTFGDATGGSSVFSLNGNVGNGGGSCTTFSAAAQHDINGYVSMAGGTVLRGGPYTINGYFALGAAGGGVVACSGTSIGLNATGVTLTISGTSTPSSGTCSGLSFCIAAGYNNVVLTAPGSGTTQALAVIGPNVSSRSAGATLGEGASGTSVSGAFYFPYGPVSLSGGASIGNGAGQCLQLIGTQITLTGGTTAASTCISSASSSSTSISLVQ